MNALLPALLLTAPCRILGPVEPLDAAALAQIDLEQVVYLDTTTGTWMSHARQTPLLVVFDNPTAPPNQLRLHLRSGESLPGEPRTSDDPNHITWRHPWLGDLQWPLDEVSGVGAQRPKTPAVDDVLELNNGDRLEGFCAMVGPTVHMEIPASSDALETIEVPWDQVRALHLAQAHMLPPVGCSAFIDGTVVRLVDLRRREDGLLQHQPHPAATKPGLGAINIKPLVLAFGEQVLPLAEATWSTHTDGTLPMEHGRLRVLATDSLRLQGEGTWRFNLPPGMTRLRAHVRVPRHVRHLVTGELKAHVPGRAPQRVTLRDHGSVLDIDCTGADHILLERTVGEHGEVGAVVDLTQSVLLGS